MYDRVGSFPLIFGGIGVLLALVSLANARLVQRWTTRLLMRRMAIAAGITAVVVVSVVLATDGRPSFWLFVALLAALIPLIQGLGPNANTMAMQPVAHVWPAPPRRSPRRSRWPSGRPPVASSPDPSTVRPDPSPSGWRCWCP
ncbi:MAG: hypothetical protein R2715_01920 [Ilumatobacteraceae bacterium]